MTNLDLIGQNKICTWWFTGLSGAGKSTLAKGLAIRLRKLGYPVCILDGDELRGGLSIDLDFSVEHREEQSRRVAEIAKILNSNGIFAIASLISPTSHGRDKARKIIGVEKMREIYVSTPIEICQMRDSKGLYAKAEVENDLRMTGLNAPYQAPSSPDLNIDTSKISADEAIDRILLCHFSRPNH